MENLLMKNVQTESNNRIVLKRKNLIISKYIFRLRMSMQKDLTKLKFESFFTASELIFF